MQTRKEKRLQKKREIMDLINCLCTLISTIVSVIIFIITLSK